MAGFALMNVRFTQCRMVWRVASPKAEKATFQFLTVVRQPSLKPICSIGGKKMSSRLIAVVGLQCVFALGLLAGCASDYATRVAQYQTAISQTNAVFLINDAIFFNDVEGGAHVVHIQKSERMLVRIQTAVTRILHEKGYSVSERSFGSVGLSAKPGSTFRVYPGGTQNDPGWFSADDLEWRQIPIMVQASECDERCVENVSKLHWNLVELRDYRGQGRMNSNSVLRCTRLKNSVRAAVEELNFAPDSVLVVTQSVTVKIPAEKKVAELLGSTALLVGVIPLLQPFWESDTTMHVLSIVDRTGDVLWTQVIGPSPGGDQEMEDAEASLESLFRYLPDHPETLSVSD
jgi:hypothetical protein